MLLDLSVMKAKVFLEVDMDINPDYNAAPANFLHELPEYYDCIEKCFETASSCWISADAFIGERDDKQLQAAIEATLNCSQTLAETVKVLLNHKNLSQDEIKRQLSLCIEACDHCAEIVSRHCDDHEHCLICVRCCEGCSRACKSYL